MDVISRQAAIDALRAMQTYKLFAGDDMLLIDQAGAQTELMMLPPAQPELCEDAVSRVGAISHFRAIADATWPKEKYNEGFVDGLEFCIAHLSTMPSVTPEQRTGKWIKLDMHRGMADHKCTACEQECYVPTCMGEPMYAFCPNCGAKMEVTE